jgi:hypothetical protein
MARRSASRRVAAALLLAALAWPAAAAPGRSALVRLQADSDEAIVLAQGIKDWLVTDLQAQRVFQAVRYLIVQQWAREKGLEALDARERALYRDPSRYPEPIVKIIAVTAGRPGEARPVEAVLTWDVPLELWEDLARDVTTTVGDLGRAFGPVTRRGLRVIVRFRDAEVLRLAATVDGQTQTIFAYR